MHDRMLPCCTAVAFFLFAMKTGKAQHEPSFVKGEMPAQMWGRLNVWDPNKPWSAIEGAADYMRGTTHYVDDDDIGMTPGHWHVIQRWRYLDNGDVATTGSIGHTVLAFFDGACYTVLESSVARGFRRTEYKQFNLKPGYEYEVATLPRHLPHPIENLYHQIVYGD